MFVGSAHSSQKLLDFSSSSRTGRHTATNLLWLAVVHRVLTLLQSSLIPVLLFCGFSPPVFSPHTEPQVQTMMTQCTFSQFFNIDREIKIMMMTQWTFFSVSPSIAWFRIPTVPFFLFLSNCVCRDKRYEMQIMGKCCYYCIAMLPLLWCIARFSPSFVPCHENFLFSSFEGEQNDPRMSNVHAQIFSFSSPIARIYSNFSARDVCSLFLSSFVLSWLCCLAALREGSCSPCFAFLFLL